jgi:hypothetical protein
MITTTLILAALVLFTAWDSSEPETRSHPVRGDDRR